MSQSPAYGPKRGSGTRGASFLRKHRLASPFSADSDFVFTTREGTPFLQGNVSKRGLDVGAATLNRPGEPKLRMHDLRHCFASMLIAAGADVVFVARQLGHANPAITLRVYAHLFDEQGQAKLVREALEARFGGNAVVTTDAERGGETGTVQAENVVSMRP